MHNLEEGNSLCPFQKWEERFQQAMQLRVE